MPTPSSHRWQFSRSGGFDQARIESAADFANLEHLDLKLWAALACPVKGLEFDERTLSMIDSDGDGRVRAPEVISAVQWCEDHLRDLSALKNSSDSLPLAQINDQTDSGKAILASARQLLRNVGKPDATAITLGDVADLARALAQTNFNGDGVIPADAASDPAVKSVVENVIDCMGSVTDRSSKPGLDEAKLEAFFAQLTALNDWSAKGDDATVRSLGAGTAAAADATKAIRAKIDDYFARCAMAAFDARSVGAVNRQQEEYLAIASKDLSLTAQEIAGFPLSHIAAGKALSLVEGVNPAWAGAIAAFHGAAVTPIFGAGTTSITPADWAAINAKLAAYDAWAASKPATAVEKLGLPRVREILTGGSKAAIAALIAQDKALEREFTAITHVEQLVRYYRDLYRLMNNFVNFSDFYSRDRKAVFQVGTLYLDGRACELCVRVDDGGKHAALAGMAKAYLAYCDCTRPSGEKMTIAAAFTGGDSDFLMVGRNGVFFDRKGRDWDATITKVIENPISIRQAFWAPYKKLVRMIEEQAAKRAAAADAEADAKIAAAAATAANADKTVKPAEPKKIDIGTVAALGVAFGAIGTLVVALVGGLMGLFKLPFWEICLAVAGIMLIISGPGMVIAWLKLRQRNMGPILDASGWAINGRVKMNVPFGGSLTSVAQLPPGSLPAAADPFGEKKSPWPGVLKTVVMVCFVFSLLNHFGLIHKMLHAGGPSVEAFEPSFVRNLDKERDELGALIKKYDVNFDGKVTRAEFTGTDDAFAAADTDGDKEITSADLK